MTPATPATPATPHPTRLQRGLLLSSGLVALALVVPLVVLVRDDYGPLRRLDASIVTDVRLADGPARDVVLALTQLGAPLLLELAAVVIALLLVRRDRRRAGYVLASVLGAELVSFGVKELVHRVRPCVEVLVGCPHTPSFPSGHAFGAAAFWVTVSVLLLPRLGRRVLALGVVVPLVVACTRPLLGVHYPSDVVVGLLMGWCWSAACTALLATAREQEVGHELPLEEGVA